MAVRYVPSHAGFVEPTDEPDWEDDPEPPSDELLATSELSVAPSRTGPAPVISAPRPGLAGKGGPPPLPPCAAPAAVLGGFSEHELAAYTYDDEGELLLGSSHHGGQTIPSQNLLCL